MELNTAEIDAIKYGAIQEDQFALRDLTDLQLAIAGGGIGNVDLG